MGLSTVKIQIFIALCFALLGCNEGFDDCNNTILITNNSAKTLYAVSTLKEGFFNYNPTRDEYKSDFRLKANETNEVKIGITLSCWEQVLEQTGGYVYIYIYEADYLEDPATQWSSAQKEFIKMYKLNAKDLNKLDWRVKYP